MLESHRGLGSQPTICGKCVEEMAESASRKFEFFLCISTCYPS